MISSLTRLGPTANAYRPNTGRYCVVKRCVLGALMGGWVATAAAAGETVTLPGTQTFMLPSQTTGHDYRIDVAVPQAEPPEGGYPVLYVLDGNARLPLMVAARDVFMRRAKTPWLMVGIGYADIRGLARDERTLDYTPPLLDARYKGQKNPRQAGQADAFIDFIADELKPAVSARFAVNTSREALVGHSFGGLFTLYALHQRPGSFSDYVAVSPSLWWNFGDLFNAYCGERQTALTAVEPRVLVLRGSDEGTRVPDGEPQDISRLAFLSEMWRVDKADRLASRLKACRPEWQINFSLFDGENHGSVMWPAARETLEFLHAAD